MDTHAHTYALYIYVAIYCLSEASIHTLDIHTCYVLRDHAILG